MSKIEQEFPHRGQGGQKAGIPQALIIIFINMLPMMAIITLVPIVPAIIGNFKDMPNIQVLAPMVLAAPGLMVALLSPYAGYLSDKIGRRKLILIFILLYGVGGVLPFFIQSFPLLLGSRLLLGVGEAFVLTVGSALWGDYFDEDSRKKWIVVQSITGTFLAALLLSLSGNLAANGWNYPFLVYSIAFVIFISALIFIYEPQTTQKSQNLENKTKTNLSTSLVATLMGTTFVAAIVYFIYTLHFSLVLDTIGIEDQAKIGNYSAIVSMGAPVGALFYRLFAKKDINFQLTIMAFFFGMGFIGTALAPNEIVVLVMAFIAQMAVGMAFPILMPWSLSKLPSEHRGRGMGFWTTSFFLGQFVSPLVLSVVRGVGGGLLNGYLIIGIICLLIAGIYFFKTKNNSPIGA